jgi:hypothetical protein
MNQVRHGVLVGAVKVDKHRRVAGGNDGVVGELRVDGVVGEGVDAAGIGDRAAPILLGAQGGCCAATGALRPRAKTVVKTVGNCILVEDSTGSGGKEWWEGGRKEEKEEGHGFVP